MNHQKIYDAIISKAKLENRKKLKKTDENYVYYENHHIIPKCLGGNNNKENLVLLKAREHFICHFLLTFIHKNNKGIRITLRRFQYSKKRNLYKISSRLYERLKCIIAEIPTSEETKNKIRKTIKGKILVTDKSGKRFYVSKDDPSYLNGELINVLKDHLLTKDKDGNKHYVSKYDPRYISGELVFIQTGLKRSKESKQRMREAQLGQQQSEETKKKRSISNKGKRSGQIMVKDINGICYSIYKNNPRYISGELISMNKGRIMVKDKNNNCYSIYKDDPRYISGELVTMNKGRKLKESDTKVAKKE